jgi:hypothetical protein
MPKDVFRREVERALTGKDREPWEIVYFKFCKSQVPVIDRALETAAIKRRHTTFLVGSMSTGATRFVLLG